MVERESTADSFHFPSFNCLFRRLHPRRRLSLSIRRINGIMVVQANLCRSRTIRTRVMEAMSHNSARAAHATVMRPSARQTPRREYRCTSLLTSQEQTSGRVRWIAWLMTSANSASAITQGEAAPIPYVKYISRCFIMQLISG